MRGNERTVQLEQVKDGASEQMSVVPSVALDHVRQQRSTIDRLSFSERGDQSTGETARGDERYRLARGRRGMQRAEGGERGGQRRRRGSGEEQVTKRTGSVRLSICCSRGEVVGSDARLQIGIASSRSVHTAEKQDGGELRLTDKVDEVVDEVVFV